MGLLSPLYLFGLAALSLPILFHLVRRTPKGRQEFSSLMFLTPTPPILTRRSRLDQIILLLLRLAALALLAFAFARPFLRESATLPFGSLPGRRLALLIDTSASMHRGDLQEQAIKAASRLLDDLNPEDEVSLYAFSDRCRRIVGPADIEASGASSRAAVVSDRIKELKLDWAASDLGGALVMVAGELDSSTDVQKSAADPEIVVFSDLQQGNRTDALQAYEWPQRVRVSFVPVTLKEATNAQPRLLESEDDASPEPRVRVVSAANSTKDQFFVAWSNNGEIAPNSEASAYVPPGQSRVVKLPAPQDITRVNRIVLRGDSQDFDNTCFVAPPRKESLKLLYAGSDEAKDADGQRHYLELAVAGDPLRTVAIVQLIAPKDLADRDARLAVIGGPLSADIAASLKDYAEKGSVVLFAPTSPAEAKQAADTLGIEALSESEDSARPGQFQLLGQIDFTHPLFASFANPRYGDFTKIHFWKHWKLKAEGVGIQIPARFDDGSPAVVEHRIGKGRLMLLAASWRPDDSQLALSSKFVPLIGSLIDLAYGRAGNLKAVVVNQPIALPEWRGMRATEVITPSAERVKLPAGATEFASTKEPGIYRAVYGVDELPCAVNLAASESNTAVMETAQLAQLGVRLGVEKTRIERADALRQQRDTELEARQKLWRWGMIGLLCVLILETWWGGLRSRAPLTPVEGLA